MNKNEDILKAFKQLKKPEKIIMGELRDEKQAREIFAVMSTGHPVKPLDHRELLFQVIKENPGKYGVTVDQVKEILSKVNNAMK